MCSVVEIKNLEEYCISYHSPESLENLRPMHIRRQLYPPAAPGHTFAVRILHAPARRPDGHPAAPPPTPPPLPPATTRYVAIADCAAAPPSLTFSAGDVITITTQREDGWWLGELNGKVGWVPANYVRPS